jgi:hypothetical protein
MKSSSLAGLEGKVNWHLMDFGKAAWSYKLLQLERRCYSHAVRCATSVDCNSSSSLLTKSCIHEMDMVVFDGTRGFFW